MQLEEIAKNRNIQMLAISKGQDIFKKIPTEVVKKAANEALKATKILVYEQQKVITRPEEISEILQKIHNTPTGGHLGQCKMYKKLRKEFASKI